MKKPALFILLAVVVVTVGLIGYLGPSVLFLSKSTPVQPEKPSSVPASAFWIGGIDGGHFISISPNKHAANSFSVSVYTDFSGDIDFDGVLQYQGKADISDRINDHSFFRYWDGDLLHLTNGESMKIIQENTISP